MEANQKSTLVHVDKAAPNVLSAYPEDAEYDGEYGYWLVKLFRGSVYSYPPLP
jgi:hypothetical protein